MEIVVPDDGVLGDVPGPSATPAELRARFNRSSLARRASFEALPRVMSVEMPQTAFGTPFASIRGNFAETYVWIPSSWTAGSSTRVLATREHLQVVRAVASATSPGRIVYVLPRAWSWGMWKTSSHRRLMKSRRPKDPSGK